MYRNGIHLFSNTLLFVEQSESLFVSSTHRDLEFQKKRDIACAMIVHHRIYLYHIFISLNDDG
jgi:hypothetical protein